MRTFCDKAGKEKYPTRSAANLALKNLNRRKDWSGELVVYQCQFCKSFHYQRKRKTIAVQRLR